MLRTFIPYEQFCNVDRNFFTELLKKSEINVLKSMRVTDKSFRQNFCKSTFKRKIKLRLFKKRKARNSILITPWTIIINQQKSFKHTVVVVSK